MRIGPLNAAPLPNTLTSYVEGGVTRRHDTPRESLRVNNPSPTKLAKPPTRAELVDALRRYVSLSDQVSAGGRREALPLRGQQALEAYLGNERENEKAFLHQAMGIDAYV